MDAKSERGVVATTSLRRVNAHYMEVYAFTPPTYEDTPQWNTEGYQYFRWISNGIWEFKNPETGHWEQVDPELFQALNAERKNALNFFSTSVSKQ